jgi:hypothetical protein
LAWVLQDARSGKYVTIPHPRYPGRIILHFFLSRDDAAKILEMILATGNTKVTSGLIIPVQKNLHESLRAIAATKTPGFADGFVVHPPNEVFELWWPNVAGVVDPDDYSDHNRSP